MNQKRIKQLRKVMTEMDLPALLITNTYNRRYISGFTGTSGYVLITTDKNILFTDFRYMTQAPQQAVLFEVIEHQPKAKLTIKETLQKLGIEQLGFEQNDLSYGNFLEFSKDLAGIKLVPTNGVVEQIRLLKDDDELQVMREAADLADQTFQFILTKLKPGVSEQEIALEMEFYMRSHGAASSSFETIVASGERSVLPHGIASKKVLQKDEWVTLDFGAYYQGYCSDITRTIVLGRPTAKHQEIYNVVLEAQLQTLAAIKPGMSGKEADAVARDIITAHGYGEYFGHGTGHGLGMEIHEAPRLSRNSSTILELGMVVTVEPGIYLPGLGGVRIEDDIIITNDGNEIITRSPKELIVID